VLSRATIQVNSEKLFKQFFNSFFDIWIMQPPAGFSYSIWKKRKGKLASFPKEPFSAVLISCNSCDWECLNHCYDKILDIPAAEKGYSTTKEQIVKCITDHFLSENSFQELSEEYLYRYPDTRLNEIGYSIIAGDAFFSIGLYAQRSPK
jgi:hypothetical protein